MSFALTLSTFQPTPGSLKFEYSNVPVGTVYMRLLLVNDASGAMQYTDFTYDASFNTIIVGNLVNGTKYDAMLTAYQPDNSNSKSNKVNDATPAAAPPAPTNMRLANRDGGLYNITVNLGAPSGDEVKYVDVNIYNKTSDALESVRLAVASGAISASRDITLALNDSGLVLGSTYFLTASSSNKVGNSPISSSYELTVKGAPNIPTDVSFSFENDLLKATWKTSSDANTFSSLQHQVRFVLKWQDASGNYQSVEIKNETFEVTRPALSGTTYNINQLSNMSFSPSVIQGFMTANNMTNIRKFGIDFYVKTISNGDSSDWTGVKHLDFLNVTDTIAKSIQDNIVLTSTGVVSADVAAKIILNASMALNKVALRNIAGSGAARWFDKIIFTGKYNQLSSTGEVVLSTVAIELPIDTDSISSPNTLGSDQLQARDFLVLKMILKDSVSGAESPAFDVPDKSPSFASYNMIPTNPALPAPKFVDGILVRDFKVSKGNSNSIVATITAKKVGATNDSAITSADLLPVSLGNGVFRVTTTYSAFVNGDMLELKLKLYDLHGSVKTEFYSQVVVDTARYNSENYASLIAPGNGIVYMIADKARDPALTADYANMIGLKRSVYAGYLNCLASEVVFSVSTGTNAGKEIVASLNPSSNTYTSLVNSGTSIPVSLLFAISPGTLSLAVESELSLVKSYSGSTYNLPDFFWVKCVPTSAYAPGNNSLSTSVSRVLGTVTYSSENVLNVVVTDLAIGAEVSSTTRAIAVNVKLQGSVGATLTVQAIPVFSADNSSPAAIPAQESRIIAADGWVIIRFSFDCSAFVYALVTNGSTSNSLIMDVRSAGSEVFNSIIPAVTAGAGGAGA